MTSDDNISNGPTGGEETQSTIAEKMREKVDGIQINFEHRGKHAEKSDAT
jgi:hypothetical protein